MKLNPSAIFTSALALVAITSVSSAADLYWDGGAANIPTDGNGTSTFLAGTWSTSVANWDAGAVPHVAWNNANLDTAIFGGTVSTGTKTVTLGSNVTVNQLKILTGTSSPQTSGNRYDIGASGATTYAITFGGSYDATTPAIDASAVTNNNFNAKITGNLTTQGGLVIAHGSNGTTPGSSGRFALINTANDFVGDITLLSGNLSAGAGGWGNLSNKVILKGGSLFVSGGATATTTNSRNIVVAAPSGIATNAASAGVQALILSGPISGSADLTRYSSVTGSSTSELYLQGDLSGFTGTFENRGGAKAFLIAQTTATSAGAWKISGGTMKLAAANVIGSASDPIPNAHDLVMSGTLDMNGLSETINGLSGADTGIVQNQLATTTATLTLGDGNASGMFNGKFRDNDGTGGILALTKIGAGSQTLGGSNSHTGATSVEAGTLVLNDTAELKSSPVTVKTGASLRVDGTLKSLTSLAFEAGTSFYARVDELGDETILVDNALTLGGGTVTVFPTFTAAPQVGTINLALATGGISGSGTPVVDFTSDGATRVAGSIAVITGDTLQLAISTPAANLVWRNSSATGVWSLNTPADTNFLNGAANDMFLTYDGVTFDNSSPAGGVTLAGALIPGSLTVNSSNNFVFSGSGSIAGFTGLTKNGSGTLSLNTTNTFTGTTSVLGGSLAVNGALGDTAVTVDPGATLTGSGTIAGSVNVAVGGTLAPGQGVGPLATGPAIIDGIFACEIDGANSDTLAVTGNLDLLYTTLVVTENSPPAAAGFVIATYTGSLIGNFASIPAGYTIDTSTLGKVILVPPASAYDLWMNNYPAITGADRAANVDFDHDGLPNGIEFVVGSDPSLATTSGLPASTVTGGNLVFTFKRSDPSEASAVHVEYGTDLQNWPNEIPIPTGPLAGPPVNVVDHGVEPDDVTVTIPMGGDPRKFARLRVTIAP